MRTIRVVLVELQGIERDVVNHALQRESAIRVVADVGDRAELVDILTRTQPDLVIWNLNQRDLPDAGSEAFAERPRLKILALERGNGTLWQLRPHRTLLGELSPSLLLRVVKEAVGGSS